MLKWSSAKHPSIILVQILSVSNLGKNQIKQGLVLCPFRGLWYKKIRLGANVLKALLQRGGETM